MTLQQQVQQHLQNTGISLRELSRQAFVSHTTIAKILKGGQYKSDTADALRIAMQPKTLDATVEQLAVQCIDSDLTHVRDTDLECAKYRRVMALEAEVSVWKGQHRAAKVQIDEIKTELECSRIDVRKKQEWIDNQDAARNDLQRLLGESQANLGDAQDKIEYMKRLAGEDGQKIRERDSIILDLDARMDNAKAEIQQLKTQLDHGQAQFKSLHDAYNQQVDDETEMLAQIDTLFAERETTATKHEQQVMRLRIYVWILIAALVFVVASGLVVWGVV